MGMPVPDFASMNETDVREIIVRPLLTRLGYEHGTEANIRTEQTFRYANAFLGRKNPSKDPPLTGRADYILEVTSYGRWVVEAKPPSEPITREAIEQAHTYAAHPEVAGLFFLLTNGREFQLFRTSSLDAPLMSWKWEDMDEIFLALSNLVGPEAIKRKAKLFAPDPGKPLAPGVASTVEIIGGFVRYEDHESSHPLLRGEQINGLELAITGGRVARAEDGKLYAQVKIASAAPLMMELNKFLKNDEAYEFYSTDEYFSVDPDRPTILQNFVEAQVPAGASMSVAGFGRFRLPFGFRLAANTQAVGYVDGDLFTGTMQISYDISFGAIPPHIYNTLRGQFGQFPTQARMSGGGKFEVKLLNV
jgi:hypothetical protein